MVPLLDTATEAVNAGWPVGALTRLGIDHVAPPSSDAETAISSTPLKRESCQTTYRFPPLSMAGAGRMSPVRRGAGALSVRGSTLFGSATPTDNSGEISCGSVQLSPPSVDFCTATLNPCRPLGLPPAFDPVLKI